MNKIHKISERVYTDNFKTNDIKLQLCNSLLALKISKFISFEEYNKIKERIDKNERINS